MKEHIMDENKDENKDDLLVELTCKTRDIEERISMLTGQSQESQEVLLDKLRQDLSLLRKQVSQCQHFLPTFTAKTIQSSLSKLSTDLDKVKPKKNKFTFGHVIKKSVDVKTVQEVSLQEEDLSGLRDLVDEKKLVTQEVQDTNYQILNLRDCEVDVPARLSSLVLKNLSNCRVRVGPVKTSVFVQDCRDCHFSLCCQQLRIHSSQGCHFYTRTTSSPIIEDCKALTFGRYNYFYEGCQEELDYSGFHDEKPLTVVDFNWLSEEVSPNYRIIE